VSPHAGYVYSGHVAGAVFGRVAVPERAVILAVNHRGYGREGAVWPSGAWHIPGADVPIDESLARAIERGCPGLVGDTEAHLYEHSAELQVPFLHWRNPAVQIVPVLLGRLRLREAIALGQAIARVIAERAPGALVVASTDLNHYEDQQTTLAKDQIAIDRIAALDPEGLYEAVAANGVSMCGVVPTTVALAAARALGGTEVEIVRHATSGDVNGDMDQVVGYLGALVR
jgi:AmmeMemoRadiSam system protein B